jgi:hypothetical protein
MDFIVGLSLTTRRHDSIFVVVDTLTKSTHFIPMRRMYQVLERARVFISEIVRLHSMFLKGSYPIEDWCLQDDFGLVSKRPWEANLNLVPCITQRQTGRQKG